MLTVEELSNRILDDHFDEVLHSYEESPVEKTETPDNSEQFVDDDPNDLEHYGVLGMKWGIRKNRDKKNSKTKLDEKERAEFDKEKKKHDELSKKLDAKKKELDEVEADLESVYNKMKKVSMEESDELGLGDKANALNVVADEIANEWVSLKYQQEAIEKKNRDLFIKAGFIKHVDDSDSLTHYGIPGMKWGVRKDKKYEPKKKDRRYDGESDQDYQNRMAREERERSSKQSERSKVKSEKRAAKERAQTQKRMLKSQERIKQMEIKAQQKNKELETAERIRQEKRSDKLAKEAEAKRRKEERKAEKEKTKSKAVNARSLTDRELNDAIQRLRNEQQYNQLRITNMALPKKTVVKAATIGGGILLAVGTAVAKQQLTAVGNAKASKIIKDKWGIDTKATNMNIDELAKQVAKKLKEDTA